MRAVLVCMLMQKCNKAVKLVKGRAHAHQPPRVLRQLVIAVIRVCL